MYLYDSPVLTLYVSLGYFHIVIVVSTCCLNVLFSFLSLDLQFSFQFIIFISFSHFILSRVRCIDWNLSM